MIADSSLYVWQVGNYSVILFQPVSMTGAHAGKVVTVTCEAPPAAVPALI